MKPLTLFVCSLAFCSLALDKRPPAFVVKEDFAATVVNGFAQLGEWERAWQRTVPCEGVSFGSWHVIGPLGEEYSQAIDALINSTWQPFDLVAPLKLGNKEFKWRKAAQLDENGTPHTLKAKSGERFLLVRDVMYQAPKEKAPGSLKTQMSLEKGSYSEWLPGRNMRSEHFTFPLFTSGGNVPALQPRNQLFFVLKANEQGVARMWFDMQFLHERFPPGSTWQYGARRFDLIDFATASFPDPVSQYRINWQKRASLWQHPNPYSHGYQFVPGCQEEFVRNLMPDGFEQVALHTDLTNFIAQTAFAYKAVDDLAATFGNEYPHAAAHRRELDSILAAARSVSTNDIAAGVKALLALEARRDKILRDNPVLNAYPLLMVKGQVYFNANFEGPNIIGQSIIKWNPAEVNDTEEEVEKFKGGWGGFSDFDIHWDAKRILFSDRHHLYERNLEEPTNRVVTAAADNEVNHYDACYLPNGKIVCVCNACWQTVPCVAARNVGNLHILDADGTNERRITYDQDHNWNPTVTEDGRVLFSRWEYADTPHYFTRLIMRMNPDGTGQMEYYGSNSYWPNSLFWPVQIPGAPNQFVAIVSGHHYANRAGIPYIFDTRKGRHEDDGVVTRVPPTAPKLEPIIKDRLVEDVWPLYAAPYPLAVGADNKGAGKYFLLSRRANATAGWEVVLADIFGNVTPLKKPQFADGKVYSYMAARPLKPRTVPRVIPDRVDTTSTNATIYLVNIYKGEGLKGYPRGSIKKLRVGTYHYRYFGNGFTFASAYEGGWDIKKFLGEVPVTPDGSAVFHVPANTAIFVQPLDAEGKAQALMRSWYNAMPGEVGSCVGCHEEQNSIPPVQLTSSLMSAPSELAPMAGGARAFSFEREIQPILSRRCVGCHDDKAEAKDGRPDFRDQRLRPPEKALVPHNCHWWGWLGTKQYNPHLDHEGDHFSPAYWRLQKYIRRAGLEADYHLLPPAEFEADTSALVQMLKLGHHGVQLTPKEWRLLYTWIDYNVPYYATYSESSMPPNPVDIAARKKYDRLYANKDNHDEDPVPLPPIPSFVAPTKTATPAGRANALNSSKIIPSGKTPEFRELTLPSGRKMRFARVTANEYLAVTEVSNADFAEFDSSHNSRYVEGRDKDRVTRGYPLNKPEQPVVRVTWQQAKAFCEWLGKLNKCKCSLPSVALWQTAAAGDDVRVANIAGEELKWWNYGRAEKGHHDGQQFSADVNWGKANAYGIKNMVGNVWEWTRDDFDATRKTIVGGAWSDTARMASPVSVWRYEPYKPVYNVGFRPMIKE